MLGMASLRLGGITIRAAVFGCFCATLGLWFFTGNAFTQRMADVERDAAAVNARYHQAQETLATVRAQVLVGSVLVRDALLDPDSAGRARHRQRIARTYDAIDERLLKYTPVLDTPDERSQIARLRQEIEQFRRTTDEVLNNVSRPVDVRDLLNRRLVPRRESAVAVSEEIQALNRSAFVQHQTVIAGLHRVAEAQSRERLGFALGASFLIALIATLYSGRLESRLRRQLDKDAENTRYLQRLSSKLITAQEEERRTIARELHDEVGQVLTAIKVELSVAERAIAGAGGPPLLLENVQTIAEGALQSVRDLSQILHPALLDDLGLAAAIERHVRGFEARHRLRVEFEHEGMGLRYSPETEIALYRIVQEALTNVARHAAARSCRIRLQRVRESILLEIDDDGCGFDSAAPQPARRRGLGLLGIRERAAQLLGIARFDSAVGRGTRLTVVLPALTRPGELEDAGPAPGLATGVELPHPAWRS
jgi:signal transduction histidine kinase